MPARHFAVPVVIATMMLGLAFSVQGQDANEEKPSPPAVGDTAPDFTLRDLAKEEVKLSALLEKGPVALVVLRGWPGYQCPICTKQVGDLLSHADEIAELGGQVLLVYPGPSDELQAHAEEFIESSPLPAHFRFVIDPDYTFTNLYHLCWDEPRETAYPSTFVIDSEGVVRFAKVSEGHAGRASADEVVTAMKDLKTP